MQTLVHYFLHLIFPGLLARIFWPRKWQHVYLLLLATMLVDLDHLLANPIFDPNRCSIGFHPLHSWWAIVCYVILLYPNATRIIAIGLCLHMLTDGIDCFWMKGVW